MLDIFYKESLYQYIMSSSDLYYGGEALTLEQPQAYTCPFCNRMGFTDTALMEHVTAEHADTTLAVSYSYFMAFWNFLDNLIIIHCYYSLTELIFYFLLYLNFSRYYHLSLFQCSFTDSGNAIIFIFMLKCEIAIL